MNLIENAVTELKREYVAEINKCIVAFANTSGGTLFIGIEDDGTVFGVPNIDDTITKVSNSIRDSVKPDVTLFVDYEPMELNNKIVLKVIVQKGTSSPYYLSKKGLRPAGVYIRQGASSVPATESTILKMIKDTDGEKFEDLRSTNQNLTFVEATKVFEEWKLPFEQNQMRTLRLVNPDGIFTNLALLLSDQCVHTIKLAVYEGDVKETFKDRREFQGSLLKQLTDVYEFIDRFNNIFSKIEGLHRVDGRAYPTEAIREVLLNCLVHRDYSFSGSTLISIFKDRIEFVSIGGLVSGISFDDIKLGVSIARNENLANVFYRLRLIEAFGTGIQKIHRSYKYQPVAPTIESSENAFKVTLPNTYAQKRSEVAVNESVNPYSSLSKKRAPNFLLSENELKVIKLLKEVHYISRKDVEKTLTLSQAMCVRILKGLIEKEEIETVGAGKNTRYKLRD